MKVLLGRWTPHYRLRIPATAIFCSYSQLLLNTHSEEYPTTDRNSWFLRYAVIVITHRATRRDVTEHSKGKFHLRTGHEGPEGV